MQPNCKDTNLTHGVHPIEASSGRTTAQFSSSLERLSRCAFIRGLLVQFGASLFVSRRSSCTAGNALRGCSPCCSSGCRSAAARPWRIRPRAKSSAGLPTAPCAIAALLSLSRSLYCACARQSRGGFVRRWRSFSWTYLSDCFPWSFLYSLRFRSSRFFLRYAFLIVFSSGCGFNPAIEPIGLDHGIGVCVFQFLVSKFFRACLKLLSSVSNFFWLLY